MIELHKSSWGMSPSSPKSSLNLLFPSGEVLLLKQFIKFYHWLPKFQGITSGDSTLSWWGKDWRSVWLGPASQPTSHHTVALRDPLLFSRKGESLFSKALVSYPLATVNGGSWGMYSLELITGCVYSVYLSFAPSSSRGYKQCLLVLYSMHKYFSQPTRGSGILSSSLE